MIKKRDINKPKVEKKEEVVLKNHPDVVTSFDNFIAGRPCRLLRHREKAILGQNKK